MKVFWSMILAWKRREGRERHGDKSILLMWLELCRCILQVETSFLITWLITSRRPEWRMLFRHNQPFEWLGSVVKFTIARQGTVHKEQRPSDISSATAAPLISVVLKWLISMWMQKCGRLLENTDCSLLNLKGSLAAETRRMNY